MATGKLTKIIENQQVKEEERRKYIGASLIGSECMRQIWYEFTGAPAEPISLKLKRTFEIGKRLEGMIIDLLREAGVKLAFENYLIECMVDKELDYFQGNVDAYLEHYDAILEIKTAKDSSFKIFVKSGLKKWNPRYYAQVQAYMGMSELNRAFVIVLNKDNSELWDEEVTFDPAFYETLRHKARLIYEATTPPPRISSSPIWYQCKTCRFRKVCHE